MPPDLRVTSSSSRKGSRNHTSGEEIELKRSRGEISCAECRRSKLKCDKVRGLSLTSIFRLWLKNQSKYRAAHALAGDARTYVQMVYTRLVKPQGMYLIQVIGHFAFKLTRLVARAVLADTDQLHRKVFEMGQRIRQLEDALAILQSNVSTEPHPLLADPALPVEPKSSSGSGNSKDGPTEILGGFGTLTISNSGEARYFGASAGSEVRGLIHGHFIIVHSDSMALNCRHCS